jgi:hypothetical protein
MWNSFHPDRGTHENDYSGGKRNIIIPFFHINHIKIEISLSSFPAAGGLYKSCQLPKVSLEIDDNEGGIHSFTRRKQKIRRESIFFVVKLAPSSQLVTRRVSLFLSPILSIYVMKNLVIFFTS